MTPRGSANAPAQRAGYEPLEETVFGRYRLLRRIGKGGMAEAFLAVMEGAEGFRRKCVVKRIRPDKAGSSYFTQMFVDEARITAALHHPNIVQVYEFGEVGNLFYLTMEYLDGRNLGVLLDGMHAQGLLMPINMTAHIIQQVARGLHYAHMLTDDQGVSLGVIHRDVSPTNIMLLRTGEVKILDFGVAKAERTLKQGATVVGKVKGKLSYMAPEQHSGKTIDLRADVFATGVILWEMLTGELLFGGANGGERSRRLMRGDISAPSMLRAKVPHELDAIVLRCLQVHPEERYPSAGALADALGSFVRASLFNPAELAALVSEHAEDEAPEPVTVESAGSGAPMVIDSHAILTCEDERVDQTDLDLMAATTTRDRQRPFLGPQRAALVPPEAMPPPPALVAMPKWRRFWPVIAVLAVGLALTTVVAPRPSSTTTVNAASSKRARAQITPVPAAEPPKGEGVGPGLVDSALLSGSPEVRSFDGVGPVRPATGKPSQAGRRRGRSMDTAAAKPVEPPGVPPTEAPGDPELRLINPF